MTSDRRPRAIDCPGVLSLARSTEREGSGFPLSLYALDFTLPSR